MGLIALAEKIPITLITPMIPIKQKSQWQKEIAEPEDPAKSLMERSDKPPLQKGGLGDR